MREAVESLVRLLRDGLFIEKEIARRWEHQMFPRCYFMYAVDLPKKDNSIMEYRAVLHPETKNILFQCRANTAHNYEIATDIYSHLSKEEKYDLFMETAKLAQVSCIDRHIFGLELSQDELKAKILEFHLEKDKVYSKWGDPPAKYTKPKWEKYIKNLLEIK